MPLTTVAMTTDKKILQLLLQPLLVFQQLFLLLLLKPLPLLLLPHKTPAPPRASLRRPPPSDTPTAYRHQACFSKTIDFMLMNIFCNKILSYWSHFRRSARGRPQPPAVRTATGAAPRPRLTVGEEREEGVAAQHYDSWRARSV